MNDQANLKSVIVLVCTHETKHGIDTYVSLHASNKEALAHVDSVKESCDYGEYGDGEYFDYNIEDHVLDVSTLSPARPQERSSFDAALAEAKSRSADQQSEVEPHQKAEERSF